MTDLRQQVVRIIDEGTGRRRTVIVQMRAGERTDDRLLGIAAEVHRRRNLTISARDLLPAARDERVAATRAFLATVLGNDPHWLGAARTFAVRATPAQLRAIAASPMVRAS